MFGKAVSYDLIWDSTACQAADESQRWLVAAMQTHGHELVTMLWRILGNEQDVCDAYQTVFLRLAHLEDSRRPRWIKAYLFRTASNVAITMLRERSIEKRTLSSMTEGIQEPQVAERDFDTRHMAQSLRQYVAQLPEHLRNVIMLRDFGELSYPDVARILGVSAGTARVYRCKAVQLLALWMNKEDEP
jgi:RNA polymerase sigma-70 factor (ECF subfamily)